MMMKRLSLTAVVMAAIGVGSAQATTVASTSPIYDATNASLGFANEFTVAGTYVVNLNFSPTAVDPAGSTGLLPYILDSSGSVTLTNWAPNTTTLPNLNDSNSCGVLSGGSITCNLLNGGAFWTSDFKIGTATITVGTGVGQLTLDPNSVAGNSSFANVSITGLIDTASVPIPTRTPVRSICRIGAIPEPMRMLLPGLCATAPP